jgi:nucleotide-binding universal stress UspA family protein
MNIRPKKILWPTDFSPLAVKAADYVRGFCEHFGAQVHVVHVCDSPVSLSIDFAGPFETMSLQKEVIASARAQLQKLSEEVFHADKGIHLEVLVGSPWGEVCEYARSQGVDLIILATHGRTGLEHIVMGSVAERIVQHASCPVLVVKSVEREFTT